MKKQWLAAGAAAVAAGMVLAPIHAKAYEIVGKQLEIYGKANISLEYQDSNTGNSVPGTRGRTTSGGEFGVSSNSSRLGFKGTIPLGTSIPLSALYQYESEINVDRGGGDTFGTRNSFFGLGTQAGDILLGYYDSAFKVIGEEYTIWGDTVADRRSILGASPVNGNRMNPRLRNMAMYRFKTDQLLIIAQYSADSQNAVAQSDNNNISSTSAGIEYKFGIFNVGAGFERDKRDMAFANSSQATWGARVGGSMKLGALKASLVYEHIDPKDRVVTDANGRPTSAQGTLNRDAFGGSLLYNITPQLALGAQVLHATKVDHTSDTAATNYSIGAWYDIQKWASVYLIGSLTDNQRNARYAVADGGHGDRISTAYGKDPRVISAGLVFSF